jgi:hypothetical protein
LDILERIEETLVEASRRGRNADAATAAIVSLLGSANEDALALISALGWKRAERQAGDAVVPIWQRVRPGKTTPRGRPREKPAIKPDSPFAGLAALIATD